MLRHLIGCRARSALPIGLIALLAPATAQATTYDVTRLTDGTPGNCTADDCSLREAVAAANRSGPEADTVRLRAGTYRLTRSSSAAGDPQTDNLVGDLDLGDHADTRLNPHGRLTVAGAGARSTTIAGTATLADRVLEVESTDQAELRDLTVTGGREENAALAGPSQGGGIGVEGTAGDPGDDARLTLRRVSVRGNEVVNSDGGGIDNNGSLTVLDSTISDNTALNGGGIEQDDTLLLQNSTISANVVEEEGGGIDNDGGNVDNDDGRPNDTERLFAYSTTIAFNTARRLPSREEVPSDGIGGGISNDSTAVGPTGGLATLRNTIIANNQADGTAADNCHRGGAANHAPQGGNVENTAECAFENQNVDARLGPLAADVGETRTHALYERSAAIDRASGCPARDQRGVQRGDPSGCDTGAFESRVAYSGDPCAAPRQTIHGTSGADVLRGTPGPDVIFGGRGNDDIRAIGGDDVVCGGAGNDLIRDASGDDRLDGGRDADRILAGAGADRLEGFSGDDRLFGETGRDALFGELGNDRLDGGSSADTCLGGPGRNTQVSC